MKRQIAVFLACAVSSCWIPGAGFAEGGRRLFPEIDALFAGIDTPGSPGASLAVARKGQIIYKRGYGYANLEYDIPITPSTIFPVASVSKQFTALAVAMLAARGRLSLDDDIHEYLMDLPDFATTITLKHLIYHTSGIRDQGQLLRIAGWRIDDVITKEQILKVLRHQRHLNFDPGDEYMYSNSGYTLLAEVVARVTGKSFPDWTQENIFQPLGMTKTHFNDDHEMIVKNRAYSYVDDDHAGFRKSIHNFAYCGPTGLFTTAEDLMRWAHNFEDAKVGGKAVVEMALEPGVLNDGRRLDYAFGLVIGEHRGQKTVGHSGEDAAFRSHLVMFPEHGLSVVVLSNYGRLDPRAKALEVADLFLNDVIESPQSEAIGKTYAVDSKVYEGYVGKYAVEDGGIVEILKDGPLLEAFVAGRGKFVLIPQSATDYVFEKVPVQITFHREYDGSTESFTLKTGGQERTGKRIVPSTLSTNELMQYTGDFYSDELGTAYTIKVEERGLIAQHRRIPDALLVHTDEDRFAGEHWWFSNLTFTRDDQGIVTGFLLGGGRVRNLWFRRIRCLGRALSQ